MTSQHTRQFVRNCSAGFALVLAVALVLGIVGGLT